MDSSETRAYVEHRLKKVGWTGLPSFSDGAFHQIFAWTGGIPRRVNLLCNRLLLSVFLTNNDDVAETIVAAVASELRDEVSDMAPQSFADEAAHQAPGNAEGRSGPLLLVAANEDDDARLCWVARSAASDRRMPQTRLVRVGSPAQYERNDSQSDRTTPMQDPLWLPPISADDGASALAEALTSFAQLIRAHRPRAFVVAGFSESALSCLLAARAAGVSVVHVQGDGPAPTVHREWLEFARIVTVHVARLFLVTDSALLPAGVLEAKVRLLPAKAGLEQTGTAIVASLAEWLMPTTPEGATEGRPPVPLRSVKRP